MTLQVDRQQCRDRRDLGTLAEDAGAAAREAQRGAQAKLGGMAGSARGRVKSGPDAIEATSRAMVGGAPRAAEGDRRLDRAQCRCRISLRPALQGASGVVRVAGPFTVESLSPHRCCRSRTTPGSPRRWATVAGRRPRRTTRDAAGFRHGDREYLKISGVQNTKKGERLEFIWIAPFASRSGPVQLEGRYLEDGARAGAPRSASARNTTRSATTWCARGARGRGPVRHADRLRLRLRAGGRRDAAQFRLGSRCSRRA